MSRPALPTAEVDAHLLLHRDRMADNLPPVWEFVDEFTIILLFRDMRANPQEPTNHDGHNRCG